MFTAQMCFKDFKKSKEKTDDLKNAMMNIIFKCKYQIIAKLFYFY